MNRKNQNIYIQRADVFEGAVRDISHTMRGLIRNPGFTATVVLTFALAIGANAAIFSVFQNVLLRPLPYPDSDRLVRIHSTHVERGGQSRTSIPDFRDYKERATSIDAMEAFRRATVLIDGNAELGISMIRGTPGLLDLIGARAARGRLIQAEDLRVDARPVVVLSYESWISRFGGDPNVVGRSIGLGESAVSVADGILKEDISVTSYTVIGVAAPVQGPIFDRSTAEPVHAFAPLIIETDPDRASRGSRGLQIVARLGEGVSVVQSQAEMDRIGTAIREQYPEVAWMPMVVSVYEATVSEVRPALIAVFAATGLILLIAVSNIANLLLARGSARKNEISMRAALGASRLRLTRLLLTESLILALLGGIAGIVLGYGGIRILLYMEPSWIPRLDQITINGAVLAAVMATILASGLLFGLAPLLFLRNGLMLRNRQAVGTDGGQRLLRSGLVVTQLTLSLVLLSGSGLMIRSFLALKDVPIGVDYRQIMTFPLGVDGFVMGRGSPGRTAQLQRYREVLGRLRALPGVQDGTVTSQPPLSGSSGSVGVELLGGARRGEKESVGLVGVTENFFEFFSSRVMAGRLFGPEDASNPDSVVVVDSLVAETLWPGERAVGQRIRFYGLESVVIGVAEPIRYGDPAQEMRPKLYHLLNRSGGGIFGSTFLIRYSGDLKSILPAIESRVKEVDSTLRFGTVKPLGELYDQYLREPRFYLLLLGSLGALALAVAAVGVYGVVAYSVVQRTGEIGIRVALGGRPLQIVGLFFRRTVLLLGPGLVAGFLGSAWLTRYIQSLLFHVKPTDPIALASMAALLAATALIATLIPMRRALRVDPARTLRSE